MYASNYQNYASKSLLHASTLTIRTSGSIQKNKISFTRAPLFLDPENFPAGDCKISR